MKKLIPAFLLIVLSCASSLRAGSISYLFTVDTSSLNGQADNLDFQLEPGDISSPFVAVDISGFSLNGGSYTANQIQLTGDATGDLSSDLLLDNGSFPNDAYQPVVLGNSLRFVATFSGAGVDNPASPGTSFGFSIYDNSGFTPLLTTSQDGTIAGVNVDADGIASFTNPTDVGGSVAAVSATPEPASVAGMVLGLCLIAACGRRSLRHSRSI